MSDLAVAVVAGRVDIGDAWDDLAGRTAIANVFQNPAGTAAIAETGYADTRTLLAWDGDALAGIWTLEASKIGPVAYLSGLPHEYAFVAGPVIDSSRTEEVTAAFLRTIATHPDLPKVIHARFLDGGVDAWSALLSALGGRRRMMLSDRPRAFYTRDVGAKRSGSTRKKMRQDWNRLAALGEVVVVNNRQPEAARAAFETFLTMEEKSWKGANGTALLCSASDTQFVRRWFSNLADAGAASVALLTLDGKPIAAQVVLRQGTTAYTWKIAYDGDYEKCSPGVLLVDKLAEQLLEDGIEQIESCSPQGGFMEKIWSGRRRTVELLIEVGERPTLAFTAVLAYLRGHAMLRDMYHRVKALRARRATKVAAPA
jgi:CelD/BcsL family acetyltransferase involved in cellulose biosynthesis